jgi:CBS domain-containing protein
MILLAITLSAIVSSSERGPDARVADGMSSTLPAIGHRRCLDEAFRILQEKASPAVAVVDASGRLVGLMT